MCFTLAAPQRTQLAGHFLNPQRRMEKAGHDEQHMTQRKAELEELLETNTARELKKHRHATLLQHNPLFAQEDVRGLRPQETKYRELKAEITSVHKTLGGMYISLQYHFLELTKSTKNI